MHHLQKRIDGLWEAANKYPARQLLAVASEELQSKERVKIGWMSSGVVQAFILNACKISKFDEMVEAYSKHLDDMPSFETLARSARAGETHCEATPTQREASKAPRWYELYLRSDHWKSLKVRAKQYYGGCVLCGNHDSPECHHRHYLTLGSENIKDLSVLCSNHHKAVHPLLGIKVPRQCPCNVDVLLRRWGLYDGS